MDITGRLPRQIVDTLSKLDVVVEGVQIAGDDIDVTLTDNNRTTTIYAIYTGNGRWEVSEIDDNINIFPDVEPGDIITSDLISKLFINSINSSLILSFNPLGKIKYGIKDFISPIKKKAGDIKRWATDEINKDEATEFLRKQGTIKYNYEDPLTKKQRTSFPSRNLNVGMIEQLPGQPKDGGHYKVLTGNPDTKDFQVFHLYRNGKDIRILDVRAGLEGEEAKYLYDTNLPETWDESDWKDSDDEEDNVTEESQTEEKEETQKDNKESKTDDTDFDDDDWDNVIENIQSSYSLLDSDDEDNVIESSYIISANDLIAEGANLKALALTGLLALGSLFPASADAMKHLKGSDMNAQQKIDLICKGIKKGSGGKINLFDKSGKLTEEGQKLRAALGERDGYTPSPDEWQGLHELTEELGKQGITINWDQQMGTVDEKNAEIKHSEKKRKSTDWNQKLKTVDDGADIIDYSNAKKQSSKHNSWNDTIGTLKSSADIVDDEDNVIEEPKRKSKYNGCNVTGCTDANGNVALA